MNTDPRMLAAGISAAVISVAVPFYVTNEGGMLLESYRDPIGIWTACAGHTGPDVGPGQTFTAEQCREVLTKDFVHHYSAMRKCAPRIVDAPPNVQAAALDFTLNVGPGNFCKSTLAKKVEAADWAGTCAEYPRWVMADNGRLDCRVRSNRCYGTVVRRQYEQALCEGRPVGLGAKG